MISGRRQFIKNISALMGVATVSPLIYAPSIARNQEGKTKIRISEVASDFEREPLIRPFGFKGGYMTEIWQTAANITSEQEIEKTGLCTQNVLWSDAEVFSNHSESGGNALMYSITEHALQMLKGESFRNPVQLLEDILDEVYSYGQRITGNNKLRKTFILNSLVGIDNALWLLYAHHNQFQTFDEMIPENYRSALSHHHEKVASIPLMSYSIPVSEIEEAARDGYFFMKIKIGQPGTQKEMLEKDKKRLSEIHNVLKKFDTSYTRDGRIPYYFDANGRYETKELLLQLLDHADQIGALDQIVLIEEPFPESLEIPVEDIGIRIAADESAHTDQDALKRIQMGYGAIALKAIAKTLSMTLKIAKLAKNNNVPCFCADLTVNPILVEWNKNVAARLDPFPGLGIGLLETNGHQNYKNWEKMVSYHPCQDASWRKTQQGIFNLNEDYYQKSGCIFQTSHYYNKMFEQQ